MEDVFVDKMIDLLLGIVLVGVIVLGIVQERRILNLEDKIKRLENK